jgi:nucleotide-binding universal stress UspA family protein
MGRSIIAAVDGSPDATNAARSAAVMTRMLRRPLVLAFVADDPQVFPSGDRRRLEIARHDAVSSGAALLDAVAAEAGVTDARRRIALSGGVHGGVAEQLAGLALEEDADLIVIGARRHGVLDHLTRRSIPAALIESSGSPVMVVPAGTEFNRGFNVHPGVLCGVDGSPGSDRALLVARQLADALGVEMHPVFVDQLGGFGDAPDGLWVEKGEPASALAEIASRSDAALVVVGTRERVGVASVARQLIRLSGVPVVVVSPETGIPRLAQASAQPALAA